MQRGSTTNTGNLGGYRFSLPTNAANAAQTGTALVRNSTGSVKVYCAAVLPAVTHVALERLVDGARIGWDRRDGTTSNWAVGDVLSINISYHG